MITVSGLCQNPSGSLTFLSCVMKTRQTACYHWSFFSAGRVKLKGSSLGTLLSEWPLRQVLSRTSIRNLVVRD